MQKVSNGLAETVLDKNTALKHQRASNRLLGERVYELEAKLRALEMSGFWNVPDGFAEPDADAKRDVLRRLTISGAVSGEGGALEAELLVDHLSRSDSTNSNRSSLVSPEVNLLLDAAGDGEEEYSALLCRDTCHDTAPQRDTCHDTAPHAHRDHGNTGHAQEPDDLVDLLPVKEQGII